MSATLSTEKALSFFNKQLNLWPEVAERFQALANVSTRKLEYVGRTFTLQHNPARAVSTGASVSKSAISSRPCFLCQHNRPQEQISLPALNQHYEILVNPFPIFPLHFTIPATAHIPQTIIDGNDTTRFVHLLEMARALPGIALFYNGARCGASAPDHFHFQAVDAREMPLLEWIVDGLPLPFRVEHTLDTDLHLLERWFLETMKSLPNPEEDTEPPVNILCAASTDGTINVAIIPRRAHRPNFYGVGNGQLMVSPASVDLAGTIILPRKVDFNEAFTLAHLEALLAQTCYASHS